MFIVLLAVLLATPGYVDDRVCGECHADHAESYKEVGMSKAFYRPRPGNLIEDFDAPPYFHERSKQYFEMRRRGDDIVFRRYVRDADGTPRHVFEQKVDWILGSGHTSRTYIYRTPGGELYQLPIAWYSRTREWRMSPGYDRADHDGVTRRVRHECMFCHNAYPAVADAPRHPERSEGSPSGRSFAVSAAQDDGSYWRSQHFPAELPEGLGCQRCHGPGAQHAKTGTRETIVNPARLDARRRIDICYECHLLPAVGLSGMRRFGRDIYSFRPGEPLTDYSLALDITERDLPRSERFEINHHPYRLEQSACFTASGGKLDCLTCHDPHRKVPPAQRAAHYRAKCMSCHETPHMAGGDCVSCHMPERRTQDVIHVVMTDHFIRRTPGGKELLAPLEERDPDLTHIHFYDAKRSPTGALGELYRVIPFVRATTGSDPAAVRRLELLLEQVKPAEIEPYLDLAMGQLRQRQWAKLEQTATTILDRAPDHPQALEWLGIARACG